jgi:hypothetical protein
MKILPFLLLLSSYLSGQKDDVSFFINKIETIYPGFKDKVRNKKDYAKYSKFKKMVLNQRTTDTLKLIAQLALYFKDRHLIPYEFGLKRKVDTSEFLKKFMSYTSLFDSIKANKDNYEGYWQDKNRNLIILIKKISNHPFIYEGIIVKSSSQIYPLGSPHFKLEFNALFNEILTEYFNWEDNNRIFVFSKLVGKKFLIVDKTIWKRISKDSVSKYVSTPNNKIKYATGTILDTNNFLLTIPENTTSNTKIVDSIINVNKTLLKKTRNLIIDIRDNPGGNINTYKSLYPFIYTDTIQRLNGYKYYREDLLQDTEYLLESAIERKDVVRIKSLQTYVDTLKKNKNTARYILGSKIGLDTVLRYPKNVAIIINFGCMSASEMMVLEFKQSKKVTVFGQRTFGAVDYLDVFAIESPSLKYLFYMPSFRRDMGNQSNRIDYIGIKPDVGISHEVLDWVNFVKKYYEKINK